MMQTINIVERIRLSFSLLFALSWICLLCNCVNAKPFNTSDTQNDTSFGPGLWLTAAAGLLCATISLAVCVCCRKPKGFAEFRGSTQLAELSPSQPGEVTLFPPPSLSLNRDDLEVCFEPLPRPQNQSVSAYRPKEITEWLENGHGLFPRYNIQYLREVGRGWFGQVVEAEVKDLLPNQVSSRCVVKILRPEAGVGQHTKFLKDVQPLLKFDHPHVLKMYGCCLESSPLLVLLQHCANGDLKQFLSAYSTTKGATGLPPLPENVLLRMAWEASEGLSQWHQAGLCHPDVATRSFMVTSDMSVVMGDYGTQTVAHRDDFLESSHQLLPVRWCAPECYQPSGEIIHTQAGNVWSFGVVLWEILSLGARPYAALTDEQVVQQVLLEKRTILNPPSFSYQQGQALYQLMLHCWEVDAPLRPKADVIASRLSTACAGASRDIDLDMEKAFESRWNAARPSRGSPSASLNNLHGSLDNLANAEGDSTIKEDVTSPGRESESGFSAKVSAALKSLDEALAAAGGTDEEEEEAEDDSSLPEPQFDLGHSEENQEESADRERSGSDSSSNSLFSSRSWQDKVTRGELTAMIRDKSRSVQDLMILTHVEPMSDIEFLSQQKDSGSSSMHQQPQQNLGAPQISVTSPSFTTRSAMMESDVPLLENTDGSKRGSLDPGTYMERNRNRLTSTPREDTDFEAMESSFRDQQRSKPVDYGPFSPESLDATDFTRSKESEESGAIRKMADIIGLSTSVILGPSDELGLKVFQGVSSPCSNNEEIDDDVFSKQSTSPSPQSESAMLGVNVATWSRCLEEGYPQIPVVDPSAAEPVDQPLPPVQDDTPLQFKDSGIARPSFNTSVDLLGSTFGNEQSANREWMDDLSLVARMWNEELAAALALDNSVMNPCTNQFNVSLSDTDPNMEEAVGNASGLSMDTSGLSSGTPSRPREETYFSYDKIDEDIREEELAEEMRRKDLSTIREEQESISSSDLGAIATPSMEEEVETGRSLLSQLQMKNRLQRQLDLSDSSDSDRGVDDEDDDEDVLVVDLENKRAVMLEGHSPKLKAAIASQNYDSIFGSLPTISPSSSRNLPEIDVDSANGEGELEEKSVDDDQDEAQGEEEEEEEEDGGAVALTDEDDEDDEEGDEGISSNFVWQACYPAKLNQSFSMEVIEEECEEDGLEDDTLALFVPSTWKADATPGRSSIKSPEKKDVDSEDDGSTSSPKKNVSFSQPRRKEVYHYPVEIEEPLPPTPTRRQWGAPLPASTIQQEPDKYADFADWEYAVDDDRESSSDLDTSKDADDVKQTVPRPSNPLTNSLMYRLSGVDDDDEDEQQESEMKISHESSAPNDEFFQGDWPSSFSLSEFQPDQFFPNWEQPETSETTTIKEAVNPNTSNGHLHTKVDEEDEDVNAVIGTMRHTLESGRMRLDLPQTRLDDDDDDVEEESEA